MLPRTRKADRSYEAAIEARREDAEMAEGEA